MLGNGLTYLLAFAGLLGVLVFVHELGHYSVARWCGVKVLHFAIGFGKPVLVWRVGADQTEWSLGLLPLGGYVRMLDERETVVAPAERSRAFNTQPVGKRSAIVAAGPLANFLLAFLLYSLLHFHGTETLLPVLGTPLAGTPAAVAGVLNGDHVLRLEDEEMASWQDLRWALVRESLDKPVLRLEVRDREGVAQLRSLSVEGLGTLETDGEDPLARLGIRFYQSEALPRLGDVLPGSVAARAGLLSGDDILSVNAVAVDRWTDFVRMIREAPGKPLDLLVARGGETSHVQVTPETAEQAGVTIGRIGVAMAPEENAPRLRATVRFGLFESLWRGARDTWEQSVFSLRMMGRMVLGEVSWKNLSGPVTIADYAGQSARLGWVAYLKFMALLSVSLGVLNLLPIPVLDGGHLMYHVIEVIKGAPLSERALEAGHRVGLFLLSLLMAFAFFNDLSRLFSG